jgi:hypothetical protein
VRRELYCGISADAPLALSPAAVGTGRIAARIDLAGAVETLIRRGLRRADSGLAFTPFALAQGEFLDHAG